MPTPNPSEQQDFEKITKALLDMELSGQALEQRNELMAQMKTQAADASTYQEKVSALKSIVESNPQHYQKLGQACFTSLQRELSSMQAQIQNSELTQLSGYAKEFGQVAQTAAVFASLVTPKAGPHLEKMAMGGFMLNSALTTAATTGWTLGPAGLCAASVLLAGQGLMGLFNDSDDAPKNGLAEAFQAICAGLMQISQQINQLGHYVEERFNRLEKILDGNHREALQYLRLILFSTNKNAIQLKALLQGQHQKISHALTALQNDVQTLFERQQAETEARLKSTHGTLKEFHFLQTQLDRRLVNSVRQLLRRGAPIDEATFIRYSRELCQAITMESHGSDTLTGRDLNLDDSDALRARIFMPLAQSKMPQNVIDLAWNNPELLKKVALKYQALPEIEGLLPNFVLLKDRALALYDWHAAYERQTQGQIPQSAYQDLQEVNEYLAGIQEFLQALDGKKLMHVLSTQLNTDYHALLAQMSKTSTEFSAVETKNLLAKRLMQIQQQEELLARTQCPVVTVSEANNTFDFTLNIGDGYAYPHLYNHNILRGVPQIAISPCLSALPIPKTAQGIWGGVAFYVHPSTVPAQHKPKWSSFDYKIFFEQYLAVAPKNVQEECRDHPIHWAELLEQKEVLFQQRTAHHVAMMQRTGNQLTAFKRKLQTSTATINLLDTKANPFQALESLLDVGSRAMVSDNPEMALNLPIEDCGLFQRFIPKNILLAELLGLGTLKFSYNAGFSNRQKQDQDFNFMMQVQFIPANPMQESIPLFVYKDVIKVSSIYEQASEVAYNYCKGDLVYDGHLYDLSSNYFTHNNPIIRRTRYQTPLERLKTIPTDRMLHQRAEVAGGQLTADYLRTLRKKAHQTVEQSLTQPKHILAQLVSQVETSAALIKLFSGLFIPQHVNEVVAILSKIKYLHLEEYRESLQQDECSLIAEMETSKLLFAKTNTQFLEVMEKALVFGDQELYFLYEQLTQYQKAITIVDSAEVKESVTPGNSGSETQELRMLIMAQSEQLATQSKQIATQNAQIEQLTAMISALLSTKEAPAVSSSPGARSSDLGLFSSSTITPNPLGVHKNEIAYRTTNGRG